MCEIFADSFVFIVYLCRRSRFYAHITFNIHNRHVFQQDWTKVRSEGVLYPDVSDGVAGEVL